MADLRFYVSPLPEDAEYPCFLLVRTFWDDYSFKTSFQLYEISLHEERRLIGTVKIGHFDQPRERTKLDASFAKLNDQYFSLGQSESFYDRLNHLQYGSKKDVLKAIRDVTVVKGLQERVSNEDVFNDSLTRVLGALNILKSHQSSRLEIGFSSTLHESKVSTECTFAFEFDQKIPSTINALIGRNGAGKSQLLVNLVAAVVRHDPNKRYTVRGREAVKKVIVVSYSVFDRFFLPDQIKMPGDRAREKSRSNYMSEDLKYVYIGLRERIAGAADAYRISGATAFSKRFTTAIDSIRDKEKFEEWKTVLGPILSEAGFEDYDLQEGAAVRAKFKLLGAGHKATLSMLTSLFDAIEPGSLVIIDEPENHLHPALLSASMRALSKMLVERSIAVVSTHSPVVVQEIPSKNVRVLRKIEGRARILNLTTESFGTNIDTLTTDVFGLTKSLPSYVDILRDLAENGLTLEQLEEEIGKPLSAEVRGFYMSLLEQ